MGQWEYLYVTILVQQDNRVQKVFINGQVTTYPSGQGPLAQQYPESFARDGWEKISTTGGRTHVFRRLRRGS